jgi:predicted enzyme related to lactoylglutathione lyase
VIHVSYVNVYVEDFDRALEFYQHTLGLPLRFADEKFGFASFETGGARLNVSHSGGNAELVGRHTGIGLGVDDIQAAYEELSAKGVKFEQKPERMPWGGMLAILEDPDGNRLFLDPGE